MRAPENVTVEVDDTVGDVDGDGDGVGAVGDVDGDGDGDGEVVGAVGDVEGDGDGELVGAVVVLGDHPSGATASRKLLDAVFQWVAR